MIHIIRNRATSKQMKEMLEMLETYVKLAVDIDRGILAGGGAMHADCEAVLLEDGVNRNSFGAQIGILPHNKYRLSLLSTFVLGKTTHRWKYLTLKFVSG